MNAQSPTGTIPVLCVEPNPEDRAALADIFHHGPWSLCPDAHWDLITAVSLRAARRLFAQSPIAVVLCERDLPSGTWQELWEQVSTSPRPPFLIVTSRVADERLWAEALNLGAYDVLAKPFDRTEVTRVVSLAWLHWRDQQRDEALESPALVAGGGV